MKLYEIVFLFIITIAHSYTLNKKPFLSNDMTNPNENVEISTKANFITLDIYNRVFPKEIGINQFIFEHPFFITHIVIKFGLNLKSLFMQRKLEYYQKMCSI